MKEKFYFTFLISVLLFWSVNAFSQEIGPKKVLTPIGYDVLKKLSDVPPIPPAYVDRTWKEKVIPNKDGFQEEFNIEAAWKGPDPVLQDFMTGNRSTATIGQNFSGNSNQSGVAPPDTDGDVSPDYYMQMVNLSFQIWNKNGTSVYGPAYSSTLWSGFTGPWTGTNDGDPIVLWDQYSGRWIATQFALPNYPSGPFYELIAVSQTSDPTGAWYRYAYQFSNMPDYPKFGVWPDGYYFTINQFAPPSLGFAGAGVCVLERDLMLSGNPNARMIFFSMGTAYGSLLPADVDGPLPPAGTPNYLANLGTNALRIWAATVNWTNPNSSTLSLIKTLTTQSFSYSGIVINQPGTSQTLDPLASRLMYRLQYRNFGGYQVMVTNHTVNANGSGQAGVRWYELRNTGNGWSIYQQGTYAPADGNDRWMASVAMNGNGDIAAGYSVSGTNTYPSIRIAGQTAANTGTGILDVTETSIQAGSASQTGVNRWGDYSMMAVDPSDDETFWYTSEYSNGGWNWRTKIASFNFEPPVVIPPVADFTASPNPVMATVPVTFTDLSTNNPTQWSWTFTGGNPATSTTRNPVVTYATPGTYTVILTATNSAGSDTETKTNYITVTEYVVTYCGAAGTNTLKEWINSVSLSGVFSKTSGNDNGYGNFTSLSYSLESGGSYNLTMSPGFSGKSRAEYWRVWIDFNMDGDFEDGGEQVFTANAQKSTVSGTINMPSGLEGATRMRVAMEYNTVPASCGTFTYGEVEDYTLSFGTPAPQPPVANFSGNPTLLTAGGSVQFTDLSTNAPTSWSWTFSGGAPSASTAPNPSVTYNTAGTFDVVLTVANNAGSDTKTVTGYITVTETGTGTYCESASLSNAIEWIDGFVIAGSNNLSPGPALYSDYTNDPTKTIYLAEGSTNSITLTPNTSSQRNFWRVWIDFGGDYSFVETGDQVFAANNKKGTATGTVSIPAGISGTARMRVTMRTGSSPASCDVFTDGEVDDYTVVFTAAPASVSRDSELGLEVYPNPATNQLHVMVNTPSETVNIKVYNALGQIRDDFNIKDNRTSINLSTYPAGIYYVGADDGQKTALKKFFKE